MAVPQPLHSTRSGHQWLTCGPRLRDEIVGGPAKCFRRVEKGGIGGE